MAGGITIGGLGWDFLVKKYDVSPQRKLIGALLSAAVVALAAQGLNETVHPKLNAPSAVQKLTVPSVR